MKKTFALACVVTLLTIGMSSSVSADRTYHTEHISLHAIGDAPLRSGSVTNIHSDGPKVYAQERYALNGALASHEYSIALTVYPFDVTCGGAAVEFFSVPISTNAAGNGHGSARIAPADVAGLAGSHGVNWIVLDGETPVYETGCQVAILD